MVIEEKIDQDSVRPAAVAGMFYPGHKAELQAMVLQLLENAGSRKNSDTAAPKALIVPHAGYIYSGQAAADVYARLRSIRDTIKRVVLLGPAHRVSFHGIAGVLDDYFATPLGLIEVDRELRQKAFAINGIQPFDPAHIEEHSLEVQLPFLQTVLDDFTLAPFVVGKASQAVAARLLETLWGGDETLIVISSDLSHFLDYDSARQRDNHTAALIESFQGEQLGPYDACGYGGIRGLLQVAREKHLSIERVSLCNSGDTAGDKSRVVGYASYVLH